MTTEQLQENHSDVLALGGQIIALQKENEALKKQLADIRTLNENFGIWQVSPNHPYAVYKTGENRMVVDCRPRGAVAYTEWEEKLARLFSAAPDLLAACRLAFTPGNHLTACAIAISKATGEEMVDLEGIGPADAARDLLEEIGWSDQPTEYDR